MVLAPQYAQDQKIGRLITAPLAYPEQLCGFIGAALAWQFVFLPIAHDVVRFRVFMLPGIAEKLRFSVPVLVSCAMTRVAATSASVSDGATLATRGQRLQPRNQAACCNPERSRAAGFAASAVPKLTSPDSWPPSSTTNLP